MLRSSITILFLFVFISCQVQERKYRKGFYFTRLHQKNIKNTSPLSSFNEKQKLTNQSADMVVVSGYTAETAGVSGQSDQSLFITKRNILGAAPDSCDVILFKDGSEIQVKVLQVGPDEIKYKRCDNPDGPSYVTLKKDLFMIKYHNGTRELIKEEKQQVQQGAPYNSGAPHRKLPPKTTYPLAPIALALGVIAVLTPIFGLFIFTTFNLYATMSVLTALLAIVAGQKAMKRIKAASEIYRGKGLALSGFIMGLVMMTIYVVIALVGLLLLLLI